MTWTVCRQKAASASTLTHRHRHLDVWSWRVSHVVSTALYPAVAADPARAAISNTPSLIVL